MAWKRKSPGALAGAAEAEDATKEFHTEDTKLPHYCRPFDPVALNDRWRVVHDPQQWILEVRQGRETGKATGLKGIRFCRWRRSLIRDIGELCGLVDPAAMAIIRALPERHGKQRLRVVVDHEQVPS